MLIEQAIFTSAKTSAGDGYRLVAASPGVSPQEAAELAHWGPSHDSLSDAGISAASVNFHRLASGRYCVSKTQNAGSEYSGRTGLRVYSHLLVLSADELARFANNPFAILRAAAAQGLLQPKESVPAKLDPARLAGKTSAVDQAVIKEVIAKHGVRTLAGLIDGALRSGRLFVIAPQGRLQLISALLNCLPVELRTQMTFSTGLRFSPRRPYRILGAGELSPEIRRLRREPGIAVCDVQTRTAAPPRAAWARFAEQALPERRLARFVEAIENCRTGGEIAALERYAARLAEQTAECEPDFPEPVPDGEPDRVFPRLAKVGLVEESLDSSPALDPPPGGVVDDDGRFGSTPVATVPVRQQATRATQVNQRMDTIAFNQPSSNSPLEGLPVGATWTGADPSAISTLEALELLDDTVFAAIGGDGAALERLRHVWPATLAKLGSRQLAESREHYIRRALASWRKHGDKSQTQDPLKATSAIEVVCALFGE